MNRLVFHASKIKCEGCVNSIRSFLLAQKSVHEVAVDIDNQEIGVKYDGDLNPEGLKTGIEALGYPVKDWNLERTTTEIL